MNGNISIFSRSAVSTLLLFIISINGHHIHAKAGVQNRPDFFNNSDTAIILSEELKFNEAVVFLQDQGYNVNYENFDIKYTGTDGRIYLAYKYIYLPQNGYADYQYAVDLEYRQVDKRTLTNEDQQGYTEEKHHAYHPEEYKELISEILLHLVSDYDNSGIVMEEITHHTTRQVIIRERNTCYHIDVIADLWEYSARLSKKSQEVSDVITYTVAPPPSREKDTGNE